MKRLAVLPLILSFGALVACPADKPPQKTAAIPVDTTKTDLSKLPAVLPAPVPDTFKQQKLTPSGETGAPSLPEAPPELQDAVTREQSSAQFCYVEFGKKSDPGLRGNVAMAVTVAQSGVTDAKVASSAWSGGAGNAVNRCLNERAKRAWKLAPGAVKPGKYAVRLSFTGS